MSFSQIFTFVCKSLQMYYLLKNNYLFVRLFIQSLHLISYYASVALHASFPVNISHSLRIHIADSQSAGCSSCTSAPQC